jgi:hypothetical protein
MIFSVMWFYLCATRQDRLVQLSQERDAIWHIGLQKDIELKELQSRLDSGLSGLKHLLFCVTDSNDNQY